MSRPGIVTPARVALVALALAVVALSLRASAAMEPGLDYFGDASASIDALVRGDLDGFLASQPLMGSFSLLLRAPFVATVFDGSLDAVYYAGALPCLLATLILGVALARLAAERGAPTYVQGIVAGIAVVNPVTLRALHWGHPEELLAAALCVGAVLAALRDRELLAGALLGLALATKQWALLAVLPALLAAPRRQPALLGVAVGLAALLTLPLLAGAPDRFGAVAESAAGQTSLGASTTPWNVWWPLATLESLPGVGERWVALALPLSALLWLRRDRRPDDALLLLALLFLARCLLDNWNNDYYHAPFLLSLLAWETVRRAGVPYLTLAVAILIGVSFWPDQTRIFADSAGPAALLFAVYAAWAVPLAAGLALALYRPGTLAQYDRRRGAPPRPAAVRDRAGAGGDRQLDRTPA
jgi:hypothetical protein